MTKHFEDENFTKRTLNLIKTFLAFIKCVGALNKLGFFEHEYLESLAKLFNILDLTEKETYNSK